MRVGRYQAKSRQDCVRCQAGRQVRSGFVCSHFNSMGEWSSHQCIRGDQQTLGGSL